MPREFRAKANGVLCDKLHCISDVQGYMKAMQSDDTPDMLQGKERLIFGNIQAIHDFHSR